jgi:nucleotide-binding universal stress UspA family protein
LTVILAASDASEHSDPVVAAAIDLGRQIGAEVTVVHVLTEQRLADLRQSLGTEDSYTDSVVKLIDDALNDQIMRVAGDPEAAGKHVLQGPVGESLLDHAEAAEASFLALGLRNRSRVGKFLMGSDVQQVLLSTPCPILGIPV